MKKQDGMNYGEAGVNFEIDESPADYLREFEKKFGWVAEPWMFDMIHKLDGTPMEKAAKVNSFFRRTKLIGNTLYVDGKNSSFVFDYLKTHFKDALKAQFGVDLVVVLAKDGFILKSFDLKPFVKTPIDFSLLQPIYAKLSDREDFMRSKDYTG